MAEGVVGGRPVAKLADRDGVGDRRHQDQGNPKHPDGVQEDDQDFRGRGAQEDKGQVPQGQDGKASDR